MNEDIKVTIDTGAVQYGQLEIGQVTTGNAGTEAKVTNSGSAAHAILNFTIPKGDKGDKGDRGEQGPAVDVSPIYEKIENEAEYRKDKDDSLQSQINSLASGSHLVASSISEMSDITRTYVNTTDGHWYYYNNTTSTWTDGGVYQATELGKGSVKPDNIEYHLLNSVDVRIPEYTAINGYYRNQQGGVTENAKFSYTSPILLNKGETISFKAIGYSTNVALLTLVDSNNNVIVDLVRSTNDDLTTVSYKAEYDLYVSISYKTSGNINDLFVKNDILKDDLDNIESTNLYRNVNVNIAEYSKFIDASGNPIEANKYFYTNPFLLKKGETLAFDAMGYRNYVSLLVQCSTDGTYMNTLILSNFEEEKTTFKYKANDDIYVRICSYVTAFGNAYAYVDSNYNTNCTENYYDLYKAFLNVGCIGDSLASGECVALDSDGNVEYHDLYQYSWGQFMQRASNNKYYNFSEGGLTTFSWLNSSNYGLSLTLNPDKKCDAYIIGLGVNDADKLGTNYLGSIDDINDNDYTQNGNTYYGNYAKIIQTLKAEVSNKCKFFLLTIPDTKENYVAYNQAVRDIANHFDNCYLIDLYEDHLEDYKSGIIGQSRRNGHYNACAYKVMAEIIGKEISKVMYNNFNDFKQVEFINTEWEY